MNKAAQNQPHRGVNAWRIIFCICTVLTLLFIPSIASAGAASPFAGHWQAVDIDGSDLRLTIGGSPSGPFNITWTESYISFCNRTAGIVRGEGWLDENDPYHLIADLVVTCFRTDQTMDMHQEWRYDPTNDTISFVIPDPAIITWFRPGYKVPPAWRQMVVYPDLNWVEGWGYTPGTIVSLVGFVSSNSMIYYGSSTASEEGQVAYGLYMPLQPGDHLWMNDGIYLKDVIVSTFKITGIDLNTQTVSGMAKPGTEVQVDYPPDLSFSVPVDRYGYWSAVISEMTGGVAGSVSQMDSDGDLIQFEFLIPNIHLLINYAYDEVASFMDPGHSITVTVLASDGTTVKATAEVWSEPKDYWEGQTGFQVDSSEWIPGTPDIQPYDWVTAKVDDGRYSRVQIGEITGSLDLIFGSVTGTVNAPWITEEQVVECLPWGAPVPAPGKSDSIYTDGMDSYSCSWDLFNEWDLRAGEFLAVGYTGPDGNWVTNIFRNDATGDRLNIYESGEQTFQENASFHISHGWIANIDDERLSLHNFVLEVDGEPREWDFIDSYLTDNFPPPDNLALSFVYNFPEGMTGVHTFTGHWFAPCALVSPDCLDPDEIIETHTTNVEVTFLP